MGNKFIPANAGWMSKYPNLSEIDKIYYKQGKKDFDYIYKILKTTPSQSMIIIPPDSLLNEDSCGKLMNEAWTSYFLYPRKVVYQSRVRPWPVHHRQYYLSINGWSPRGIDTSDHQGLYIKQYIP
jgi:hypothetical protein